MYTHKILEPRTSPSGDDLKWICSSSWSVNLVGRHGLGSQVGQQIWSEGGSGQWSWSRIWSVGLVWARKLVIRTGR